MRVLDHLHEDEDMLKIANVKYIELQDWNDFVSKTYGKPYNFQQQDGCKTRGIFRFNVPLDEDDPSEDYMNDEEEVMEVMKSHPHQRTEGVMGVKFAQWLERDTADIDWREELWWHRYFYPSIHMLIHDLHGKGLLEEGQYAINIDW